MSGSQPLDRARVERIWKRAVLPYIEEQFFGDSAKLAEFDLDHLVRKLSRASDMTGATSGDQPDESTTPTQANDGNANPS